MSSTEARRALRQALLGALLLASACTARKTEPPPAAAPATFPPLTLRGSFSDGTPLSMEALRGRPWVINVWLPG
jgi:hypothetical protein